VKQKAFVLNYELKDALPNGGGNYSQNATLGKKDMQYIEKIKRLTDFMSCLRDMSEDEPCDVQYKAMFPNVSKRTMQRNFATLSNVGYEVVYKRTWIEGPPDEWHDEPPIGYYYIEFVPMW
jgi:hypothetical protein